MDAKDLRTLPALSEHKDGSKYSQSSVTLQSNRNKSYQDTGCNPLGKAESAAVRPCAVIGPDRVVPPPVANDAFPKKGSIEPWPCPDNVYSQLPDYPQHIMNNQHQMRNISPRQTYQENMQRILVPPTYSSIKNNSDSSTFNHAERTSVLSKNTKPNNLAPEAKYCDVPYAVNQLSNEHKNVRDPELCVPSANPTLMRAIPHGWPPNSANVHGPRSYGAHDLYQYQQYQSCAGPRPPILPMGRPQRPFQDEPGYVYTEPYYQDPSVRFKPYPQMKERHPQTRFDYISNYSNHFHPPPTFPPHKYDIPKPGTGPIHHYPMYPNLKYLENRTSEPTLEAYQRHPNQLAPGYNMSFRNQLNHLSYPPGLTNAQSKLISYQVDSSGKPLVTSKMAYENNNKVFIDYENARNKPYTVNDAYIINEINRAQPGKSQIMPPSYPANGMHPVPTQFFRKDIPVKSHEYLPHFRNFDPSVGGYSMIRHSSQFSPNAFAISPTDSNTSNDTSQTQTTNQEDCGYVSQSSTASARSIESGISRMTGDYYRKPEYRYGPLGNSLHAKHEANKNKKQIDVRQFLQMWNEGDDENGENNTSKEVVNQTGNSEMNNYSKQQDSKQEQLYVLGLVNVPSEELSKYEHIQKVSKLPENIKGYNSIELLKHFEEAIESSSISPHKPVASKEFHVTMRGENRNAPKQVLGMFPRPLSPLDVEAKISQSVIHKEVGCNFEIKPCSPKMLNVEIAAPVQNVLGERSIEKVSNPLSKIQSPISIQTDDVSCRNMKRQDPVINYENSSCKVLSSPYSAHNLDNVKTDYSIQDLETNSGVCLASLPRLDNEIELNFPEVNQQFIDANKIESASNENNLSGTTLTPINSPEGDGSKPNISDFQLSEKLSETTLLDGTDYSKLSKYRKMKPSLLEMPEMNVNAVRTDSVIIENPENLKRVDYKKHDCTQSSLKENDLSPINLTSHIKMVEENIKEITCIQNNPENVETDLAIDFSLNKPDILSNKKSLEPDDSFETLDSICEKKYIKEKEEAVLSTIDSLITPQNITEAEHRDTSIEITSPQSITEAESGDTIVMNESNVKIDENDDKGLSFSFKNPSNELILSQSITEAENMDTIIMNELNAKTDEDTTKNDTDVSFQKSSNELISPQKITEAESKDIVIMNEVNAKTDEYNNKDLSLSLENLSNELLSPQSITESKNEDITNELNAKTNEENDKDFSFKKSANELISPQSTPKAEHKDSIVMNELNAKTFKQNDKDFSLSFIKTSNEFILPQNIAEAVNKDTIIVNELNAKTDERYYKDMSLKNTQNEISYSTNPKDILIDNIDESNEKRECGDDNSHITSNNYSTEMEFDTIVTSTLDTACSSKKTNNIVHGPNTPPSIHPLEYDNKLPIDEANTPSFEHILEDDVIKSQVHQIDDKIENYEYSDTDNDSILSEDIELPKLSFNIEEEPPKVYNNINIPNTFMNNESIPISPKISANCDSFDRNMIRDGPYKELDSVKSKKAKFNKSKSFMKGLYSPQIRNLLLQVEGFINSAETNYENIPKYWNEEEIPKNEDTMEDKNLSENENTDENEGTTKNEKITENEYITDHQEITDNKCITNNEKIAETEDVTENKEIEHKEFFINDTENNIKILNRIISPFFPSEKLISDKIKNTVEDYVATRSNTLSENNFSIKIMECESKQDTKSVIAKTTGSAERAFMFCHEKNHCIIAEPGNLTESQIKQTLSSCNDKEHIKEPSNPTEFRIGKSCCACDDKDQSIVKKPDCTTEPKIEKTDVTDKKCASDNNTTVTVSAEGYDEENECHEENIEKSIPETIQFENTTHSQYLTMNAGSTHIQCESNSYETENEIEPDAIQESGVCTIELGCIDEVDNGEIELQEYSNQHFDTTVKRNTSLKRSLSDSALNTYTQEKIWASKRRKTNENNLEDNIINENLCDFIQNTRRNSISSINNEENVSFCILIDDACILTTDTEQEKICFAKITENNDTDEIEENILLENVVQDENVFIDSSTYECQENESINEKTWVEDIACVETVVCDDIADDLTIKSPSSPKHHYVETEVSEEIAVDMVINLPSCSQNDEIESEVKDGIAKDVVISSPSYTESDDLKTKVANNVSGGIFASLPKPDFEETELSEDIAEDVIISSVSSPENAFIESEKCDDIDVSIVDKYSSPKDDYIESEVGENLAEAMGLTSPSPESNHGAADFENSSLSLNKDSMDTENFNNISCAESSRISFQLPSKDIALVVTKDVVDSLSIDSPPYPKNYCLETAISNVIKGNMDISYPSTPQDICFKTDNMDYDLVRGLDTGSSSMSKQTFDRMEVNNVVEETVSSSSSECDPAEYDEYSSLCDNLYKHTNKIKSMYRARMTENHAQIVDTLFRTSQPEFNKMLKVHNDLLIETLSGNGYLDNMSESGHKDSQAPEYCIPSKDPNDTLDLVKPAINDESVSSIPLPSHKVCGRNKMKLASVTERDISQDNTVNSCESSTDNILAYEDSSYTSSSPEVSSTTSEERNSSILLKITNLNGARISQINEIKPERKPRCKFTENKDYSNSSIPNRPLITKAAQKYIPPIKESIRDLKVKISLPQQSLLKLKQLKLSKTLPKVINKQSNSNVPKPSKKPKPNFEDVLKSIDEIQIKMHKEKNRKPKTSVPKVVIKKNEYGSHYTSTPTKETFNPDLTGRKWQPWVFLEKNSFIDNMVLKNKTKAILNHRKNTYVLAEKFKKYKSVATSTKFVISQPNSNKYTGQLKYTIKLKHSY